MEDYGLLTRYSLFRSSTEREVAIFCLLYSDGASVRRHQASDLRWAAGDLDLAHQFRRTNRARMETRRGATSRRPVLEPFMRGQPD